MAKILISFLGTGPRVPSNDGDLGKDRMPRKYRDANYFINDEGLGNFWHTLKTPWHKQHKIS